MARLIEIYWGPVYGFVRGRGLGREEAEEVTQSFFVEVVVGRRLLETADQSRGRLRNLLRGALKRYLIDLHRRSTAAAAAMDRAAEVRRPRAPETAEAIFERRWARAVAEEAQRRTRRRFELRGQLRAWEAFEWVRLRSGGPGPRPIAYGVVAKELGYRSSAEVAEVVRTVRESLQRTFEEVVRESVEGCSSDLQEELDRVRELVR